MQINSARDLALYVRGRRHQLTMTQAELAKAAAVSRRWLSSLEAGKPTAEIGLVLRTLDALELVLDVRPEDETFDDGERVDLDALLRDLGGEQRD